MMRTSNAFGCLMLVVLSNFANAQDNTYLQVLQNFSNSLYSVVAGPDYARNCILSPLSVDISLTLLLIGSSGAMQKQILSGLGYPTNYSLNLIQSNSNLLLKRVANSGGASLVTKLYMSNKLTVQAPYKTAITKYFDTTIQSIDFTQNEAAAKEINSFVANASRSMIENILTPDGIKQDISMILVNVIFFQGVWMTTFNKSLTAVDDFMLSDGSKVSLTFMQTSGVFKRGIVSELNGAIVVDLPYANSSLTMTLVMPSDGDTLQNMLRSVESFDWRQLSASLRNTSVIIVMPKFNATFKEFLNKPLIKMGFSDLFNASATNIDRIAMLNNLPHKVSIDYILHQAVISVDEQGTRAAAATVTNSRAATPKIRFRKPFLYALRTSSSVLFMGQFTGRD